MCLNIDCTAVAAASAERAVVEKADDDLSKRFELLEVLGQGTTGVVRRGLRREDGREVALKMSHAAEEEVVQIAKAEFEMLRRVKHPNIVQAVDFLTSAGRPVLILELFGGLPLSTSTLRTPQKRLAEPVARRLFATLLEVIGHLHRLQVIHRDVKPDNVLVSEDLTDLRLVDFNTARWLEEGAALTMTGDRTYAAPEFLAGESPSEAGDVWAAGLCLHFMLAGRLPAACTVKARTVDLSGTTWSDISQPCKSLLLRCLATKALRPTASEALASEWLLPRCQRRSSPCLSAVVPRWPGQQRCATALSASAMTRGAARS